MSELPQSPDSLETVPDNPASPPAAPGEPLPERTAGRSARGSAAAVWLIALLVVVVAGIAAAPFWAPAVMPLLPWSRNNAAAHERALAARFAALERRNAALKSSQDALSHRLGADAAALAGLKSGLASLGKRIDAVAAQKAAQPTLDPAAVRALQQQVAGFDRHAGDLAGQIALIKSGLASLGQRVDAVAAQAAARPAANPAAMQRLQQQVAGLDGRAGDLASRIASLETRMAAPARAEGKEAGLLVALLQMRERLDAARPLAAPYAAFLALAQGRPKLLAAAKPLAALAHDGVASRTALARDLSHLAGPIATARVPAAADDWKGRVLDQLRRLVTIRRIGGGRRTSPEAAVERAQADLARGDLGAAVKAIETLSGPSAAAARPWLAAARRRLAAEAVLARLQQKLEADIARRAASAFPATAPAAAPQPPAGPGAR